MDLKCEFCGDFCPEYEVVCLAQHHIFAAASTIAMHAAALLRACPVAELSTYVGRFRW